ncbi:MAG: SUMF1/EgtB/PvdO family nonheme iron enzyme [Succinivibrio sp.]|nr:SUMF1/EgtB/PvdO family nonheme iron enzyme [Succinivibrio sp.]
MRKLALALMLLSFVTVNQSISQEIDYHFESTDKIGRTVFNPHPMKDDLILPLPCRNSNYHIVFRKVYTNPPNDTDFNSSYDFYDGTDNARNAAIQSKRQCKVRGSFSDSKGSFFYISKYELTQGKYEAIVNHKCPKEPSVKDAIAKSGISIDEAKEVARLYSDFLQTISNAPKVHNENATAILPYECFWSFAQSGGLAVSKTQLEQDLPNIESGLSIKDYAWGEGTDSANGKVQVIGQKRPSELGLFDMLGNVQEYMDEPFQATATDELSAQKGGSTVRGGGLHSL